MGIYLPNMEMPKSCYVCPFCDCVAARCNAVKSKPYTPPSRYEERADFCPLVPVPPHGDLIDKKTVSENLASVLNKKNPPFSYPDWNDAIVAMMTAPTIIPAEEGEP